MSEVERLEKEVADERLYQAFSNYYSWLYEDETGFSETGAYHALISYGDELIKRFPEQVEALAKKRMDLLVSDREVVAFACSLAHLGMLWNRHID